MRKVIGIGETILDIIFRNEQPSAAVPGGSVFNGIVSLSRTGVPVCFISETGNDHVGNIILRFMRDNHISTDYVNVFPDGKSPVSLAFLDDNSDAEYIFYKDYPKQRLDVIYPKLEEDDIVVIGSYYALNPVLREKVLELLDQAREKKAIVYYDPNFRSSHKEEAIKLRRPLLKIWNTQTLYAARRTISSICTTCAKQTRYTRTRLNSTVPISYARQERKRLRSAPLPSPKNMTYRH